jgi:hypothetical protein
MENEKLKEIRNKVKEMSDMEDRIESAEKALSDLPRVLKAITNIGICLGNTSNSHGSVSVYGIDQTFVAIFKAGLLTHLEGLKTEFEEMKL